MKFLVSTILLLITATGAVGAGCKEENYETKVSGYSECLLMRRYGSTTPATMVVWLHGNISTGGPANYQYPIAEKFAAVFASYNILSVALVRPGYPDGSGEFSTGNDNGRADNWTRSIIAEVGSAIEKLRLKYKPKSVILVGHSGGAATAAVLLGMSPKLAEAAVLVSCPCDLVAWRIGRRGAPWSSENPILWIDEIPATTKVIALTGTMDGTTSPEIAESYIDKLKAHGNDAAFLAIADVAHRDALGTAAVSEAIVRLIKGRNSEESQRQERPIQTKGAKP
ncbi:MAG: alpha/beta hydrolase [Desulfuromonadaceae bacterium]|nr:alpha/beta hydrolase [Desulfuromonadaceae bacterium]